LKDVEAAGQKLKDIFSEIANKSSEAPGLGDLLSSFNKPRSTGSATVGQQKRHLAYFLLNFIAAPEFFAVRAAGSASGR
jgi:hypothetical protein